MARPNVREQILDAGLKTLLEKGFNGCGVQEITDAAGVPKGSFYNHFESKEALGAEIVERYARDNPRRAVLKDASLPPLERLRAYFGAMSESCIENGFSRGCLLGNFSAEMSSQSPLIRERLAGLFAAWTKDIEACVRQAQAEGAVKNTADPAELAAFLLDAYEGALLRARVDRSGAPFQRFHNLAFSQILT
jgi:TetR/AcrR family transcriptional repressor of nem operon